MTDTNPTWMQFVNFDGRITGETARLVKAAAEVQGVTPQELLNTVLVNALNGGLNRDTSDDVKVEPMTINAGNGGFHVVTVVADGYGYLVAEDSNGVEKARVASNPTTESEGAENAEFADDLGLLMRRWLGVEAPGDEV